MSADQFILKVWFPVGVLAVLVAFVLEFVRHENHIGDPAVGTIIGLAVVGLPVLYGLARRFSR